MGSTSGSYVNGRKCEETRQGKIVLRRPQSLVNRVCGGQERIAARIGSSGPVGYPNRRRV